jgi:hypothetical protein
MERLRQFPWRNKAARRDNVLRTFPPFKLPIATSMFLVGPFVDAAPGLWNLPLLSQTWSPHPLFLPLPGSFLPSLPYQWQRQALINCISQHLSECSSFTSLGLRRPLFHLIHPFPSLSFFHHHQPTTSSFLPWPPPPSHPITIHFNFPNRVRQRDPPARERRS